LSQHATWSISKTSMLVFGVIALTWVVAEVLRTCNQLFPFLNVYLEADEAIGVDFSSSVIRDITCHYSWLKSILQVHNVSLAIRIALESHSATSAIE
jgi:hypothetical protein